MFGKFVATLARIKIVTLILIATFVILYSLIGFFFFNISSLSFSLILQGSILSILASIIYNYSITMLAVKNANTTKNILGASVSILIVICIFSLIFNWFNVTILSNWLFLIVGYICIVSIMVFAFKTYYKITGQKLNEMLYNYKSKQK